MKKLFTLLFLIIATSVFSQEMMSGANINSDYPSYTKAGKGTESVPNKFGFDKVSALRLMNYEKTATGDMVIKVNRTDVRQDKSIEENFDKNNNSCPNGQCGSNFFLWGALSVAAGLISILTLKSK
ncbi:MAG: hypothetical protein LWX07_04850 [Bacteroidetes bacterium]|nr:hypothetical protein [Bacteroidota bacterium]